MQRAHQPKQVLNVERLVEAEGGFHLRDDFGRGFRRHQQVDRIAGHDMDQAEHDEGHAEQDGDGLQDAACGEDEHAVWVPECHAATQHLLIFRPSRHDVHRKNLPNT